ncbi:MAG: tyrosine-type recombinase/integrase [Beijerinckiaceae bacterium]|nr:tyrosine-type recombinase/integrase [Beijerinckiaceae bacterium]
MKERRRLPKYVSEFEDRHGKWRVRYRRAGQQDYYFKATPYTPEFNAEYQACLNGERAPSIVVGKDRAKPGTFSALIAAYYASPEFTGLKPLTRSTYRGILERFRNVHGDKRVATIERKHIKAIIGGMAATPSAANHLLDRIKALMGFALDIGLRLDDPTIRLRGFRNTGDGYHTWTDEELAIFEARHPIGTKARLAYALMLCTGQRRSDAVTMGWQHVADNKVAVRQQKTSARLKIRVHRDLQPVLDAAPRDNLTFLVTEYGKPFTAAGFGGWFRDRCDEAGLPQCSAHGLRKAAARRLAEAGCTNQQIKAITGHKTDREVARYTAAADQERLADQAMDAIEGPYSERELSNRKDRLANSSAKALKTKEH